MPGIIAKIIMGSMMKGKPKNTCYVPRDYAAVREQSRKNSTKLPLPRNTIREKTSYGYWYSQPGASREKVLFYIHGGGFNSGGAEYSFNMAKNFCKTSEYSVFNVEYRLAPEYPFPAGLDDCIAAYKWLLSQGVRGKDMVFAGDSAGGNLVFALALYLRDHGMELPSGLCGISPVGTLDDSLPSRKERIDRDCIIGADFTEEMQITYVHDHDVKGPYLSPIYGDFTGLPPIWMCVGTEEVFYDDAFAIRSAAQSQGIQVELLIGEGLCHVYPMFPDSQSTKAIKSMRSFVQGRLLAADQSL
ncbi:MAG: alpha/beta hydrolase [Faecousia sp.]